MPFPTSKRVYYDKNPLEQVVCQARFTPILRIDTEVPSTFQEHLRSPFPSYQRAAIVLPVGLPPGVPPELLGRLAGGSVTHEFGSADGIWKLLLSHDQLTLVTTKYRDWSDFKSKMRMGLDALVKSYDLRTFVRLGLRYQDRIDRRALGLDGVDWRELINPEALGELAIPTIARYVEQHLRELIVTVSEIDGRVRIVHGIQPRAGGDNTYIIDADFFTEQPRDTKDADNALDQFNSRAGHLFRWYITPRLHEAMGPRDA
jgi:uncharacterized protein (TIGR04255 family)